MATTRTWSAQEWWASLTGTEALQYLNVDPTGIPSHLKADGAVVWAILEGLLTSASSQYLDPRTIIANAQNSKGDSIGAATTTSSNDARVVYNTTESWDPIGTSNVSHINKAVLINKQLNLEGNGLASYAKPLLDAMPNGYKAVRFFFTMMQGVEERNSNGRHPINGGNATPMDVLNGYAVPWYDNWVTTFGDNLHTYVTNLSNLGGELDEIVLDVEIQVGYHLDYDATAYNVVKSHPQWSELEAELEYHGYDTTNHPGHWNDVYQRAIWNGVMRNRWGKAIEQAMNRAKEVYPNLVFSNYESHGISARRSVGKFYDVFKGWGTLGDIIGDFQSFSHYGYNTSQQRMPWGVVLPTYANIEADRALAGDGWDGLIANLDKSREAAAVSNIPIKPWIGSDDYLEEWFSGTPDNIWYEDSLYHLALSGQTVGYYWYNVEGYNYNGSTQSNKRLNDVLIEVSNRIGYVNQRSLDLEPVFFGKNYVISGMDAGGKLTYRVSWDNRVITDPLNQIPFPAGTVEMDSNGVGAWVTDTSVEETEGEETEEETIVTTSSLKRNKRRGQMLGMLTYSVPYVEEVIEIPVIDSSTGDKTIARAQATNLIDNLNWNQVDEYIPTSGNNSNLPQDITNPANAGKTAIISNTFTISGNMAANQIIVPQGGLMSGTNIGWNNCTVAINHQRAFNSSARFSSLYPESKGCLFPELFGGGTNVNNANAIEAMILGAECGYNKTSVIYPIESPKTFSRGDIFKWNGNNSTINCDYTDSGVSVYMLSFTGGGSVEITDLVLDGLSNHVYSSLVVGCKRGLNIYDTNLSLDNVTFQNFLSSTGAIQDRAVAVRIDTDFTTGDTYNIYNCNFYDIACYGEGTVATSSLTGISKAIWATYRDIVKNVTTGSFDFDNLKLNGILGDDADGIFFSSSYQGGAGKYIHNIQINVSNSEFRNCARRFVKGIESNITYDTNVYYSMSPTQVAEGLGNVYPANSIKDGKDVSGQRVPYTPTSSCTFGAASVSPSDSFSYDGIMKDCTFYGHEDGMVQSFTGGSQFKNIIYENNNFLSAGIDHPYGAISFGDKTGAKYDGVIIRNNNFENCGIAFSILADLAAEGWTAQHPKGISIESNTFDMTVINTGGTIRGVITVGRADAVIRDSWFTNNILNFNYLDPYSNFGGILGLRWAGITFAGLFIEDNVLNLTGQTTNQKLVNVLGNFGAGNSIKNNVANGMTATNAIKIDGTQNFENVNNKNDNNETLTIQ